MGGGRTGEGEGSGPFSTTPLYLSSRAHHPPFFAQGNDNDVPDIDSDDEPKRKKRKKKKGQPESDSSDDEAELKLEKVDPPLPVRTTFLLLFPAPSPAALSVLMHPFPLSQAEGFFKLNPERFHIRWRAQVRLPPFPFLSPL